MSILELLLLFFGGLVFLFFFWKRLKEDYGAQKILSSGFFIIGGINLGLFIAYLGFRQAWFWLALIGLLIGVALSLIRNKLRPVETLEAGVMGGICWLFFVFAIDSVKNASLTSLVAALALLALIFLFFFLETRYKNFAWYRSGKLGFSGLTIAGLLFLLRSVFALLPVAVLSFMGREEPFLSGIVSLGFFAVVFKLSRD